MRHFLFIFLLSVFTLQAGSVLAVDIGVSNSGGLANKIAKEGGYDPKGVTDTTLSESIGKIVKIALSFVGTLFFVLTVYAGFLWMTASGNEEQVGQATSILKMALIGLIITLAAYGITVFVLEKTALATRTATCVGTNC